MKAQALLINNNSIIEVQTFILDSKRNSRSEKKLTKLKSHLIQIIIIRVNLALKSKNFGTKYSNDIYGQKVLSEIDEVEKYKQKRWQF